MKKSFTPDRYSTICIIVLTTLQNIAYAQQAPTSSELKPDVDKQAHYLMDKYQIPGMSFGITIKGQRYFFNYGVADKQTKKPVTKETIFELGSVSKTFTGSLASYANIKGKLNFNQHAAYYLPELKGSIIGKTPLSALATYTAGGLPLSIPDKVTQQHMMTYFRQWEPELTPGIKRLYSNPSIGLLGYITASNLKQPYPILVEQFTQQEMKMHSTYARVPSSQLSRYAFGYNSDNQAVRVNPGVLDSESYGIKSDSEDMVQYIEANMGEVKLDHNVKIALENTRTGYYRSGHFIQGLAWEMYPYPVSLTALTQGNSSKTALTPQDIEPITPPTRQAEQVWVNKTGSTNGFGAYVAFIPSEKAGIVILANKNYPNEMRVKAAYEILQNLTYKYTSSKNSR